MSDAEITPKKFKFKAFVLIELCVYNASACLRLFLAKDIYIIDDGWVTPL